jgi:hypothetical protein
MSAIAQPEIQRIPAEEYHAQRYAKPKGADSAAWRGGRILMPPENYVGVFLPGHPRANGCGYVREHLLVAERALGSPLPRNIVVHHVDGVVTNNRPDNLLICDSAYHRLIHMRLRIFRAGGNPDRDKLCCTCKGCLPRTSFTRLTKSLDGLAPMCKECSKAKCLVNYHKRKQR